MAPLPRSARLTCWANAWLAGTTSLEEACDAIRAADVAHHVIGLPGETEASPLLLALGTLRRLGARGLHLALPVPGDPLGLAGPAGFTQTALEAGEAVVCEAIDLGAVPLAVGPGVQWQLQVAATPPPVGLTEADAELTAVLLRAIDELARLDVAHWRPEIADAVADLHLHSRDEALPPGYPARAGRLAGRSQRCLQVYDLAVESEPDALTASEAAARASALRPLERAARRGMVAACAPFAR